MRRSAGTVAVPYISPTASGCSADICRAFEQHYPGHIQDATCSFKDRKRGCLGP